MKQAAITGTGAGCRRPSLAKLAAFIMIAL